MRISLMTVILGVAAGLIIKGYMDSRSPASPSVTVDPDGPRVS